MLDSPRKELWGGVLDGRYQLGRPLGAGATGIVFAAHDQRGRRLAIKLLRECWARDAELSRRLREEARVGRSVRHPGIAACVGEGALPDGSPYVVFERVEGESLLALLQRCGQLSVPEVLLIAQRVAGILAAVRDAGYVHRDVKPEHIVLHAQGKLLFAWLLDFGVCLPLHEKSTCARFAVYGTPGYASPEQAAGELVDGRSDLFALGATLFEALAGCAPFIGPNPVAILTRTLRDEPPVLGLHRPDCPKAVQVLVKQLLSRDRAERPADAHRLNRALLDGQDGLLALGKETLCARLRPALQSPAPNSDRVPTRRLRVAS